MITFSIEPTKRNTPKPWKLQIWLSSNYQAIYYLHDPQEAKAILEFIEVKTNQQISKNAKKFDLSFIGFVPKTSPTSKSKRFDLQSLPVASGCGDRR
ncbi:MAG TPA: hypothetical protein DD379_13745 [Cyanobacteria bacterium UBA11162]|nr:hypothetical protein [Cyanobacteria bacterium UBA12227]HAX88067.1 hypothetical protein [Cyanobacteria bacterium UBA11370]HBL12441.1 hypothetical protein [Cyanobacteria bacterium UBA11162]HBY80143.1 hypothetical protein [Cyanobacteria bacterium UBA11148]